MLRESTCILCRDLYATYLSIKREHETKGEYISRQKICELISRHPAPQFYISAPTAMRYVITPLERGEPLASRGLRNKMHRALYARYQSLRAEMGKTKALLTAISQPAPSFYLGVRHIDKLLYDAVRSRSNKRK